MKPLLAKLAPLLNDKPYVSPSPLLVTPVLSVRELYSYLSFKITFITPAIASDPYWAEAPSRSISTRLIASVGMADRSAPVSPLPGENCTYNNELKFFLLPLINIRVRLGPRFLISYGSSKVVASLTGVFTVLNEGTLYCMALSNDNWPVDFKVL